MAMVVFLLLSTHFTGAASHPVFLSEFIAFQLTASLLPLGETLSLQRHLCTFASDRRNLWAASCTGYRNTEAWQGIAQSEFRSPK